jgi:hypothetical protein
MGTVGSFHSGSRRCLDALKTFLSVDAPISKRAVMYRLLSMGLLESTKDFHNFNRALNRMLENEKLCGDTFDDDCFVDNRRRVELLNTWTDASEFQQWCAGIYRRDFWHDQPQRVEVWLEKDTAAFLVRDVTGNLGVPLRISAGHYSRTFLNRAARDISGTYVPIRIFYIGDFDPSGLDIERAAQRGANGRQGVADFLERNYGWSEGRFGKQVTWQRIGVTEKEYHAMPERARVPLKEDEAGRRGDPRAEDFKARYGDYGVEVEALEVMQAGGLARRLDNAIRQHIDGRVWQESKRRAARDIALIRGAA